MKIRFIVTFLMCLITLLGYSQHPLSKLETPFTKYRVSTKVCSKLTHSSGSIIFVPDAAFDLSGTNNVDSVDIYYRELRSPLDMVAHHVPMTFSLMGKKFFLESNGMFEIWCKNGEDTVNVHEDRSIEVRFAVSPEQLDVRMEGYRLDVDKGEWESYTSRLGLAAVNKNDGDLWGSPSVQNESDILMEDENGDLWAVEDSIRKVAFQAMEIFDFGLYNYDRIIENETYVSIKPSFINEKQEAVKSTIYIVYDDINSVFEYPEYTWEDKFSIIAGKSYKMFAVDDKGQISILKKFPNLQEVNGTAYTFQLHNNNKPPENRQELAQITGIR